MEPKQNHLLTNSQWEAFQFYWVLTIQQGEPAVDLSV